VLFLNAIVLVPLFVPDGFRGDFYLNLPFYLTFTSNWFVTNPNSIFICAWTLATEEQFYLIWPHVLKVFNKWRAVIFVIITVIINQLAIFNASYHFKFLAPFENYLLFKIIQSISTPICFGVLLAFGLHSERFYKLFTIFRNKFSSLAYFLLMLFCIYVPNEITPLVALVTYFFMMLFVGSCVYQEKHFLSSLLNSKLFFQIGAVSYGMYLFNMMCIFQVRSLFYFMHWWNPFLEFIVSLAACYLLAHISFYYYENRFLLLKRKFSVVPTMFNQLKR
jgi:peptidoglycan/LPS O-acetylase OafA/YrhL